MADVRLNMFNKPLVGVIITFGGAIVLFSVAYFFKTSSFSDYKGDWVYVGARVEDVHTSINPGGAGRSGNSYTISSINLSYNYKGTEYWNTKIIYIPVDGLRPDRPRLTKGQSIKIAVDPNNPRKFYIADNL